MKLKRSYIYGGLSLLILAVAIAFVWWQTSQVPSTRTVGLPDVQPSSQPSKPSHSATPPPSAKISYIYSQPTTGFKARATKKLFGTYVSPGHSPISPERFQGYHTGTDAEYGDIKSDVAVHTIAAGKVIAAQYVSGYGGAVAIRSRIDGANRVVIYGHLDPNRLPAVGRNLSQGQQFAYLGVGYSSQTDGERKHLHLAILRGDSLDWRGYVQSRSELNAWLNPLTVLNQKT